MSHEKIAWSLARKELTAKCWLKLNTEIIDALELAKKLSSLTTALICSTFLPMVGTTLK